MALFHRLFIEHPASVNETYLQHFYSATRFGALMLVAGIACMIHGLLPAVFVTRGSDAVRLLHERMIQCRVRRAHESSR